MVINNYFLALADATAPTLRAQTNPLSLLWFGLIAVLWIGYLVLEGFDFGVGMLTSILPKGSPAQRDRERRLLINTIGPHWDGNEVWLLTAGGATFAAFPEWYATLFSGFYLPLLLILLALIIRGVSFEYRGKINNPRWSRTFEWGVIVGSWVPSFLWGVAFANLVRGVLLGADYQYIGGFGALLNPFALLGGVATTLLFLLHGALFVALKTFGVVRGRALRLARLFALLSIVCAGGWAVWAQLAYSRPWTWIAVLVAALCLVGVLLMVMKQLRSADTDFVDDGVDDSAVDHSGHLTAGFGRGDGLAFALSALALVAVVVLIFGSMYPDVMPGRPGGEALSIAAASSTPYTLRVMSFVALILTPLVIAYQIWSFRVFRRRLSTAQIPAPSGLSWQRLRDAAF